MCLYPKTMYSYVDFITGERIRTFLAVPKSALSYEVIRVPCGKCLECLESFSREWSFRIMDEASKYDKNCVLTLTYNDDCLPDDLSVNRRDYQLFLKLFRKHISSVRYFGCAEYGGKRFRPHYHIILFGYEPVDLVFWCKSKSGQNLYRSPSLEYYWAEFEGSKRLRSRGFLYVGKLDIRTAKYCSKYLQKFAFDSIPALSGRAKPFTFMSTHPGIGGDYHKCLSTDKLYLCGSYVHTPRYYLKLAERDGIDLSSIRAARILKANTFGPSFNELVTRRKRSKLRILRDVILRP